MKVKDIIVEAVYPGNIGAMEVSKFFMKASPEQKAEVKKLIADKKYKIAWQIIQNVLNVKLHGKEFSESCWKNYKQVGMKKKGKKMVPNCVPKESIEEDWNKVNHHDKTDGLSQKAVNAYRREHPGSKLQTAVTTKPSKLKAGSKDAKRRKSFCARMSGNKGPMKDEKGRPTPKAKALARWNCESVEEMVDMIIENMDHSKDNQAVPELKAALLARKDKLQTATDEQVYNIIDAIMTRIAKSHGISGQKLHDMWVKEYDQVPDTWIMK